MIRIIPLGKSTGVKIGPSKIKMVRVINGITDSERMLTHDRIIISVIITPRTAKSKRPQMLRITLRFTFIVN